MTWSRSRSCSHRTVSTCLVQGRSANPPLPNRSIAVRSEPSSEPTTEAILPPPCARSVQRSLHVFWYSSSKTDRFRVFVSDRSAPLRCRFIFRKVRAILDLLRQMRSCVSSMFLGVYFVVVAERNDPLLPTPALKINKCDVMRSCDWTAGSLTPPPPPT